MARGRMISKSLGSSVRFTELQDHAGKLGEFSAALFCLLVANSDDFGRLEGDAKSVKWRCWPSSHRSPNDFALALEAMDKAGLILWYEVEGRYIVEVVQFSRHQSGLHKRTHSKFPDPPGLASEAPASSNNHRRAPVGEPTRAQLLVESYPQKYFKLRKQSYLHSRIQDERDLEAAEQLCRGYGEEDLDRIVTQYLKLREDSKQATLIRGKRRTLGRLTDMAEGIATRLKIEGVQ